MMFTNYKNVLVLAPHTDDGELGCGGTVAKLVENGATVHYVAFSLSRESVPAGFPEDILATEVKKATAELGIQEKNVHVYDFPVRKLNFHRQDILEALIKLRKEIQPDLVLLPSLNDIHQDHETIAREGLRAFKNKTVLAYELLWNNISYTLTAINALEPRHVQAKVDALAHYESQKAKNVDYLEEDFLWSMARVRGAQIGQKYAEAFEVIRWVM